MGLRYENLDPETRAYMVAELDHDIDEGRLYLSPRLSPAGASVWPGQLREALLAGTDDTLAQWLSTPGILNSHEQSQRNGVPHTRRVPINAASTLAEGEFNRFHLRGLSARASEEGALVEIYRGRFSSSPRPESEKLIGQVLDPAQLLLDLRSSVGVDTALGLPPGPNSGLTAKLR